METRRSGLALLHYSITPLLLTALALATVPSPGAGKPPGFWSVVFSPDGHYLAAGSYGRVMVWEVAAVDNGARAPVRQFTGLAGPVRALAWSGDGKWLAAGSGRPAEFGEVHVWNAADPANATGFTLRPHRDTVESLTFDPSGNLLLSASDDETIATTDLRTHKVAHSLTDHTNRVTAAATSPDRRWIATGSLDKTVKIWDGAELKSVLNIDVEGGQVYTIAFAGGGNQLFTGTEDGKARLFRLEESRTGNLAGLNANLARVFEGNRTPLYAVAAPGARSRAALGAYSGLDPAVHVVDLNSGAEKFALRDCVDAVYCLTFSADGSRLAAASRDGKLRVWSMADGKMMFAL